MDVRGKKDLLGVEQRGRWRLHEENPDLLSNALSRNCCPLP